MLRLLLFAVAGGIDDLSVAAALSATAMTRRRRALLMLSFAVFGIGAPLCGFFVARQILHLGSQISFGWFAPAAIAARGVVMVALAFRGGPPAAVESSCWNVIAMPLAVSIDNLFTGVIVGSFGYPPVLAALAIGATSALLSVAGFLGGAPLGRLIPDHIDIVSGGVLIAVGAWMCIRI